MQGVSTPPSASYVGHAVCVACHQRAAELYAGSHHDRSMQKADAKTVLGNFNHATFVYNGITSTFSKRGDSYFVRTDGPDGALHDYRIAYTFGVDPLQQYLIEIPGGRLQALGIAWDTRPKAAGGQRWFHLYPDEKVDARDVLHWTGPAQNWNYMCAECHSTNVKKNYSREHESFATTWSDLDVACEACHGPGSRHVQWAQHKDASGSADDATHGLLVDLRSSRGSWVFADGASIAHLSAARASRVDAVCARCHARRSQISEDDRPDEPLEQSHRQSLLDDGLYQADGQILDEVFEWGSFQQSRMHARGVVCTDCHDAHSGRLTAAGNAVCGKCHLPAHYDAPEHHHHKPDTAAARCVACHMPARNYMVVHRRHDHSFRVPRPDLSTSLTTSNTCTDCHIGRSATWAADSVAKWYGPVRTHGVEYGAALAAGRRHQAGADRLLGAVIGDASNPAIVRATALSLLQDSPRTPSADLVVGALRDSEPLVRRAAVALLIDWEPQRRWQLAGPLLSDPLRSVRLEAVNTLAAANAAGVDEKQRNAFVSAVAEFRSVQAFNADRADSWLNLGSLDARLGDFQNAESDYRQAIRLQPSFVPPYVNLADLYRAQARDPDAERVLRQGLATQPDSAELHHALGLALVRQQRPAEALPDFAQAARLDTQNPRYAYVYAVALDSQGRHDEALALLQSAQQRFTGDRDILAALVQYSAQAGDEAAARRWRQRLLDLDAPPAP
ncbi:MAG TPA: tetratricopeptide repeat protein [Candidatus Acidoferrales bacterium]|nr:tetratricopeptide repeat protein [Candidatus Acidoferrales bacterium]